MGRTIIISTADIPASYCPPNFRDGWAFGVEHLSAELSGNFTSFNYGPDTPDPDNQDLPWFKTDANFAPERWYTYSNGAWISRHPCFPGMVILWEGAEGDIDALDGGEAGAITEVTGPMWQRVTEMNGRFPVGPGTLAGSPVAVTATGGSHEHTLDLEQVPPHTHKIKGRSNAGANQTPRIVIDDDIGSTDVESVSESSGGKTDGTTKAVNHLPPYRAMFFLRKTGRTHYRV